jgi:hypothetical protein
MATILDKDLVRESTSKIDDREIVVTLTEDQKISMKLKGLKSGDVSIEIDKLFNQLKGVDEPSNKDVGLKPTKKIKQLEGDPMISLYNLRTNNLVTKMDFGIKMELEKLICELIKQDITIFENE